MEYQTITDGQQSTVTRAVRELIRRRHPAPGVRGYDLMSLVMDLGRATGYEPIATFCGVEVPYRIRHAVLQKAVVDCGFKVVRRYGYCWVVPSGFVVEDSDDVLDPAMSLGWLD